MKYIFIKLNYFASHWLVKAYPSLRAIAKQSSHTRIKDCHVAITPRNDEKRVITTKLLLMISLLFVSGYSHANEAQQRLEKFLSNLDTMEATLIQTVTDAQKELIDESEGKIWISRPQKFKLVYTNPTEQVYVADGKRLWFYDKDLEQVTIKEQGDALGSTPAMLLSGTRPIDEDFRVEELGKHEGFHWMNLYPKSADATFDYIRIAMEEDTLRAMEMVDNFGQTSRLYFDTVTRNPDLSIKIFQFTPPEGVDVIGEVQ